MVHTEIEERLSAYVDGELTPAQREIVELHLHECPDCQRTLAEFRLVGKRLALLGAPLSDRWQPDVAARVSARIARGQRRASLSRQVLSWAAGALAVAMAVIVLWALSALVAPSGNETTRAPETPTSVATRPAPTGQPTEAAALPILESPGGEVTLYLFDADLLTTQPVTGAVRNLGYRLATSAPRAFVIAQVDDEQQILTPEEAPSIFVPAMAQTGDRMRLFAVTLNGETTSVAEFTLAQVEGSWRALDVHRVDVSATLHVKLPTPAPEVADLFQPTPFAAGPEVAMRLEKLYIAPEQPRQGQPFTVTAVIHNLGDEAARVPVWFGAFLDREDPYPTASNLVYLTIPAGREAELSWDGRDRWQRNRPEDLTREHARLVFQAGVNLLPPGGYPRPVLFPETARSDNHAEITVNFLPYEPQVSDACPPGDNLWLELDQGRVYQDTWRQSALRLVVHNEGNVEAVRVPLRITDARGDNYLIYARWTPPCGGAVTVEEINISADRLAYPITITLNPPDAPDAVPESDHSDNVLVVGEYAACTGDTDLWLTADDVIADGDDLLVTVHLSGQAPNRSFSVRVYHTADGRLLGSQQIHSITCEEPLTLRFEGILGGLSGGYAMVQIDTEAYRVEPVYPQHNNTALVPLP